ncbi:MAG: ADP-forming succinate--CoA ligase subunit beta [Tissierellales bacterium]|jgi:succinyl-CoA synthetase beta subunit|nr:ADP-forming succinate--CoA ligase subunit beta [Tissierellales bacterium]
MKIHEYQAKQVLKQYDINVPNGFLITKLEEVESIAWKIETDVAVVKAQIHAGGRGKAGGVKIAKSIDEVIEYTKEMLGKTLVTHQTGIEGKSVQKVWIEEGCDIDKEYYIGLVLDRSKSKIVLIASEEGGTEIEEVAKNNPEKIIKLTIDPFTGLTEFQARYVAKSVNIPPELISNATEMMKNLYKCFVEKDASIAEINPLVTTKDNKIVALDAKINFDDNGLFRQDDILKLRDKSEEDERELEASKHGLSYIALDGSIGCLVNGAGLAMATMDIIEHYGAKPANFLDVGGGATTEKVKEAFKIILSDSNVRGIFVNIFGGIMKCDVIAEGIVQAAKELELKVPLVIRLEGTNVERGREILRDSTLEIETVKSMGEGAKLIAEKVRVH